VFALLLGLYRWATTVDVREVPVHTPMAPLYHCFLTRVTPDSEVAEEDYRPRNIAQASGWFFANGSQLAATLYLVENGKVIGEDLLSVGQSPDVAGIGLGGYLKIIFALGDVDTPQGRFTSIGSFGATITGATGRPLPHDVEFSVHILVPGAVGRGEGRVVYAEGEQAPVVTPEMTIEEFATVLSGYKSNSDNWLEQGLWEFGTQIVESA
jgi:hypothetical protein